MNKLTIHIGNLLALLQIWMVRIKKYLPILIILLFAESQMILWATPGHENFKQADLPKEDSPHTAILKVYIEGAKVKDTLTLFFWQDVLTNSRNINEYLPHNEMKAVMNNEGLYVFRLPEIYKPGYFILSKEWDELMRGRIRLFEKYLIEPGDDVRIDMIKNNIGLNDSYRNYILRFSGKGAAKYQCRYQADTISAKDTSAYDLFDKTGKFIPNNHYEAAIRISINVLDHYKKKMSKIAYEILKADFVGKYEFKKYDLFTSTWDNAMILRDTTREKYLARVRDTYLTNSREIKLEENAKGLSLYYPSYIVKRARINERLKIDDANEIYKLLKKNYYGELQDKILTIFLLERFNLDNGLQTSLNDALATVKVHYCLEQLRELNASQSKGAQAYNFSLPDSSGKMISLQDFKGKVVFIDFWFTGCGSCLGYYQYSVSKVEREFEHNPDIVFISINIDRSKEMWMNSVHSGKFTSPNLPNVINLYTAGLGSDHPIISHYKISGYPTPLLIDRDSKVFCTSVKCLGTHDKLVKQIKIALNSKSFL